MADQRVQRRLAAILAVDVVGYSRLMAADESGTLAALKAHRTEFMDPLIAEHGGRIVKLMGDGALVEFASVVDAVECADAIQRGMAARNADKDADRRIVFRIGINLGDIIIEGDDIYGDGVNVAARLEALAEPGGICISGSVREQVHDKVPVDFADLGEQSVKNLERPVRVYRAIVEQAPTGAATAATAAGLPKLPEKPSIAVLPFANMSGDPEQEYFADGIAEDIITGLSRLKWLFVIARNSSFTYKGRNVDVRQIGRELGVRYVLEGSVRKGGDRARITGQLIDTSTGAHLWADRFDGGIEDIFDLQDQVTSSVLGAIAPTLQQAEIERATRKPTQNLDAWECFIRGLSLYSQHSNPATKEAIGILERAVTLDPGYAQAHGLTAVCLAWRAFQGWEDRESAFASAAESARRAFACDAHEPWAFMAQAFISIAQLRNPDAVEALKQAIEASPNFAYAHGLLGAVHAFGGRPDQALEWIDRGVRLSPRDIFGDEYQLYYALAHFQAGRYAEAAAAAESAIRQRPEHPVLYIMAAASYGLAGGAEMCATMTARLRELVPDISAADIEDGFPYCRAEDRSRLADALRAGGLSG